MITRFGKITTENDGWDVGTYFRQQSDRSGNGYHRVSIGRHVDNWFFN